jgi:lysophospholipase L1-like esterase
VPNVPRVAIEHDSYGVGAIGTTSTVSFAQVTGYSASLARALGLQHRGHSTSGSGIRVANTSKYINRIADLVAAQPEYVLVMGSVNDIPNRATRLPAEAATYFQALKASNLPDTKILAVGVITFALSGTQGPAGADATTAVLKAAATAAGIDFLDTTGRSPANAAMVAGGGDNLHATLLGAQYLGTGWLPRAIAERFGLPL